MTRMFGMNVRALAGLSVSLLALGAGSALAEDCAGRPGPSAMAACDQVALPVGENTEAAGPVVQPPLGGDGFLISVDGAPAAGDPATADGQRQADLRLSDADVDLRFDGFGVAPRLDAGRADPGPAGPGDRVVLRSRTNYPAFLARAEFRIYDMDASGGSTRLLTTVPVAPNGEAALTLPEGRDLQYVLRVYDRAGRYDETAPLPFGAPDRRGLAFGAGEEEGSDNATQRNIPIRGGAVTVHVRNLAPGARLETLGTSVVPDPSGAAVVQRILPPGHHGIDVRVPGALDITRDLTIPASDWFTVGVADLSFGRRMGSLPEGTDKTWQRGRLQFYAKGKTARGYEITASADTREDDLSDLLGNVLDKDPRAVLGRLDPDLYYPTYGDDSILTDDTPTSSGLYVKVEKDGSFGLWGDFKSKSRGTELLRNERSLYGGQLVLQSRATTPEGEARLRFEGYAAEPDQLPQRDLLRGTGGSVYFLSRQDLLEGSETLTVQVRDPDTGRVISTRGLVNGQDYSVNYAQGVVTLYAPLSSYAGTSGLLSGSAVGEDDLYLVAQYEWAPVTGDVDGMAFGARVETWATDRLRLGMSGQVDRTGLADQTSTGADLLWKLSEGTYLEAEAARSEGPGFGFTSSIDGGLTLETTDPVDGTGEGYRLKARADLADLRPGTQGHVEVWAERRTAGFSSIDHQTTEDEELWGLETEVATSERGRLAFRYEHYRKDPDEKLDEARLGYAHRLNDRDTVELAFGHLDREDPGRADRTGRRQDAGAGFRREVSDLLSWELWGRTTVARSGGIERADRAGVKLDTALGQDWRLQTGISAGHTGWGGEIMLRREKDAAESTYLGYVLDPDRTLDDVTLTGRDHGKFVGGARRKVGESTSVFGENSYDLFGQRRTLASSYGVEYAASERTVWTGAAEFGRVADDATGDLDRVALSFGVRYDDGERLSMKGRLELRRDSGTYEGRDRDSDTILGTGTVRYALNDAERIVSSLQFVLPDNGTATLPEGDYIRYDLGYALRPTDNDRLNLLAKYQYLYDLYGQETDGVQSRSPRQKTHVVSLDAEYDVTERWTLGGKLGMRFGASSAAEGEAFVDNDAWLGVVSARYHLVHNWDLLAEVRQLHAEQAGTTETGVLVGGYRQVNRNMSMGLIYNFGRFSDDLTDLVQDDKGLALNLIAQF
ncbi:hypothetical protein GQY15_20150 [Rhodobacter sphaeroides]|nr:hypothetical protein [Cereibacter sphaeroides]